MKWRWTGNRMALVDDGNNKIGVENVMCMKGGRKRRQEIDSVAVGLDYQMRGLIYSLIPHLPNVRPNNVARCTTSYCITMLFKWPRINTLLGLAVTNLTSRDES